jgi:phage terminase small subunit
VSLTPKQEAFASAYIETGNASEAYRRSYNAGKMNTNALAVNASRLLDNANVALRIEELQKAIIVKHNITIESILAELEEARQLAMETGKAGPAVQASMGKAKLVGLDKQIIDHTSSDGTMSPKGASLDDFYVQAKPRS